MNDDVSERTIRIMFRATEMSMDTVHEVFRWYLNERERKTVRTERKERRMEEMRRHRKGEIPADLLTERGATDILQMNPNLLRGFRQYAARYGVDYAILKDRKKEPPAYELMFRAVDEKPIEQAMRECMKDYEKTISRLSMKKKLKDLHVVVEQEKGDRAKERHYHQERGGR